MFMHFTPRCAGLLALACVCAFAVPAVDVFAAGDANNEAACSNEALTGFSFYLPDCRAYEMVTPPYKGGAQVHINAVSEDGSRVVGQSISALAGAENLEGTALNSSDQGAPYELERAGSGWKTVSLNPPASTLAKASIVFPSLTPDLKRSLWLAGLSPKLEQEGRELYIREPDGVFTLVGPAHGPDMEIEETSAFTFSGASADLSHIVFDRLWGGLWPGDTSLGRGSLYEYVGTGNSEPFLVGVRNDGALSGSPLNEHAELISRCGTYLGSTELGFSAIDNYNAVSESGGTIFFTALKCGGSGGPAVNELYARVGGEKTVAISSPSHPLAQDTGSGSGPDECNSTCEAASPQEGIFQGASRNGSKVFFLTGRPLLNGDGDSSTDLYEGEIEGEGLRARLGRLVQVSRDPTPGRAAEVQGVVRVSEDGSHVYFVARGVLTTEPNLSLPAGRQTAVPGEDNLYVYEPDPEHPGRYKTAFVATLSSGDGVDWRERDERPAQANACASTEEQAGTCEPGRFLVFSSLEDLVEGDTSGVPQIFEYDAQTETLVRVSVGQRAPTGEGYECPTTKVVEEGFNCNGNTTFGPDGAVIPKPNFAETSSPAASDFELAVSGDGSRVFFTSADALTPRAIDNVVVGEAGYPERPYYTNNIYEYHDGNVYLISDGRDTQSVSEESTTELVGTDRSGADLFLKAADGLVGQDTDTDTDLYDARIGGGFPPSSAPVGCAGDVCQGPLSTGPSLLGAGSASQPGGGNLAGSTGPRPVVKPKALTRAQKLARALKACRAERAGRRRASCQAAARRRYGSGDGPRRAAAKRATRADRRGGQ